LTLMKRIGLIPIILLGGSLLVLLVMLTLKGLDTRKRRDALYATNTAVMMTLEVQQTEDARPTETPQPSATPTPEPTATAPLETATLRPAPTEEPQPTSQEGCNRAVFIADVTIPDKTKFDPNVKFTKTWRLLNDGTCTWTTGYKLYYYSGDKMSGPTSQKMVSVPVPPGATIEISVELRAPEDPGTYKGFWALKNPIGEHFGLGPLNKPFYVEIVVVGSP
jgi:hypothetical protein